ncbi:MAG: hypothetical protein P4N59_30520 [Negativicutes bacterium]|nr:hypothetical protein [Negativicutes bacterium]
MNINSNYNIALYNRLSDASVNPQIQSSDKAKILYQEYRESKAKQANQNPVAVNNLNLESTITLCKPFIPMNADAVEISQAGLKLFDTSNLPAAPTDDPDYTAWCAQQYSPTMSVTAMPTTFGYFGNGTSLSQPVNFKALSYDEIQNPCQAATQNDYVNAGVINEDYVTQFNAILKDSKGDLRLGDNVLQNALSKYAELKDSISNSNSPDANLKIQQLENSLSWAVGTSLNRFGADMTNSKSYNWMYGDGSIAKADPFTYDNSAYKTATNIVFSAAKLVEKGISYINDNQYDPKDSADVSKLLSAMNRGTNDTDSSNLSLSTLNNVISTFKSFELAPNSYILNNAGKAAQNAPTSDIAAVYTNMKYLIENYRLGAFYGVKF